MSDGELIFDDGQKRRDNSAGGKVEKPEAPKEQQEEDFHGRGLYTFPGNFATNIRPISRCRFCNLLNTLPLPIIVSRHNKYRLDRRLSKNPKTIVWAL
jgi:hypothetical protein